MPSASPLAAICQVIQQVKASATADVHLFQDNEAATRAALIDPILRALGWDTTNVRMVEPERMVANKQSLDYVLKDAQGNVRSVVEAKKLGESLDKLGHVGAVIGYAFSLKPHNFFITDGLNWHCYSPAHSTFHPVETIDFRQTDLVEAALRLIQWLDAAQSGHGILASAASNGVPLSRNLSALSTNGSTATNGKVATAKPSQRPSPGSHFIELAQVDLQTLQPGQKPKELRLPNGEVKQIKTWKDILLEVCRLALATNDNIRLPLPDKAGKKTFLLSNHKPAIGSTSSVSYKNKDLFIYTNYSAAACLANAIYAAEQIPQSQKSTTVAVGF